MQTKTGQKNLEVENLQPGSGGSRKGKVIMERTDEKIEVEIRHIFRIAPHKTHEVKQSFEEWADRWDRG